MGSVTYPLHTSSFGQWPGVMQQPELDDSAVRHEQLCDRIVIIDHEREIIVFRMWAKGPEEGRGKPRTGDPEDPRSREIRIERREPDRRAVRGPQLAKHMARPPARHRLPR